jgi:tryptophan-rich sensory protein
MRSPAPTSTGALRQALALAGWLLACFAAGPVGSQFTPGTWYAQLERPAWTPPLWVFGLAWSLL